MNELLNKGRNALSLGEWKQAKNFLRESIAAEISAEAYEELASASWWLNETSAVFEYRLKAYNLFLDKNDRHGASRMASLIGMDYLEFKGEYAVANGWFRRAENLLEGLENSMELILIKIMKARLSFLFDKNIDLAVKLADESLELSKSLNNAEGEMLARASKGFMLVYMGKIPEGMQLLDEATLLAMTSETGDINKVAITCCLLIDACEQIRDYERACQWCGKVKEICKRWRHKAMFATCRTQYASVLVWKGNWLEAEMELLSAANELREYRPLQINSSLVRLADLRRKQGRWAEASRLLDEVESHWLKPLVYAALAFDKGEYANAVNFAERFLRQISEAERTKRIAGLELLLQIYVKLRQIEKAEKMLRELQDMAEMIHTLPLEAALLCGRGILNFACEKYEAAKQDLEDAIDIYDKINSPFESSRTCLILSEVLLKMNEFHQAEFVLNSAAKNFQKLGAEKDYEKSIFLLKNLFKDNLKTEAAVNKYELTAREIEVLSLIAEGKNNDEIAERLFLSVRTVEKHITNIYQKLGISGKSARAFAASYAIKNNLLLT
jgi:DNA-binding CsgD family transcriptional regulator